MKNLAVFITVFILAFVTGALSLNLFYFSERQEMLQLAAVYHQAQIDNDKETIDRVLAPDFVETGYRIFVQTPEAVSRKDVLGWDLSKVDRFNIEIAYPVLLNLGNNDPASISFIRTHRFNRDKNDLFAELSFHVTYTFERYPDGLKIKRINRNFLVPWRR